MSKYLIQEKPEASKCFPICSGLAHRWKLLFTQLWVAPCEEGPALPQTSVLLPAVQQRLGVRARGSPGNDHSANRN